MCPQQLSIPTLTPWLIKYFIVARKYGGKIIFDFSGLEGVITYSPLTYIRLKSNIILETLHLCHTFTDSVKADKASKRWHHQTFSVVRQEAPKTEGKKTSRWTRSYLNPNQDALLWQFEACGEHSLEEG